MVVFCQFLSKLLYGLALTVIVHGQDQSGFISLDCGSLGNSSYTNEKTGLNYISDSSFIETGVNKSIAPEFLSMNGVDQQLGQLRSFPDGDRNCYYVELVKDTRYLIKATFLYGNYDGLNKLPTFDLHIGPNKWVTVRIQNESFILTLELIHVPLFNHISVCLVRTGPWTPFISVLEIRPLHNGTYVSQSGSLALFNRVDVGSLTNQTVRYPDDVYDRNWYPLHFNQAKDISTNQTINYGINVFRPPSKVMQTATTPDSAITPSNSDNLTLNIDTQDNSYQIYVYMHFVEISNLGANDSRQFNISLNGDYWYGPVIPVNIYPTTIFNPAPIPGGKFQFIFYKVENSTMPPLLNALEVYYAVSLSQSETNQVDVDAISKIKSTYGIVRNWQGDPCAPQDFKWDGLNCSYSSSDSPMITSLDLSSSGLTGEITHDLFNLKSLKTLDLSNNSLTGHVPDFLSKLPLKSINLAGNNLTGAIPEDLFNKWRSGSLSLSVIGNPNLCQSVSCHSNKKNVTAPVTASVAGLVIILAGLAIILWRLKRKSKRKKAETMRDSLELKRRQFTYSEVQQITNSFTRILGRGGFGTVYHGYLDDVEVAVKMLSPSSAQGYKEFQAEVKLLLTVHHKNLTSLVGYCYEDSNMALIYEYMPNGNLKHHLSNAKTSTLSWEGRLQIALEAAQGLEYLHNGCKPPIVHRDIKTTNILLNKKFLAKLADFGLSRTFSTEGGSHVSTVVAGTPGYLDPEYYLTNWLTEKSDVYSFGVVLLEIITGQPVLSNARGKNHLNQWVRSQVENGDIQSVVDPRLGRDFNINTLWKIVELAMACVSPTSAERPNMYQVAMELTECLASERARSGDGISFQSKSSDEFLTMDFHTGQTPLAR